MDIAHVSKLAFIKFMGIIDIARELGKDWMLKVFEKLEQATKIEIEDTFESFRRDVVKALKYSRAGLKCDD